MLVVRDAMLAERRNSRASRGLPRKIGKGEIARGKEARRRRDSLAAVREQGSKTKRKRVVGGGNEKKKEALTSLS
ncbi:uncharacterized protein LOC117917895 isoform X2 [Vitis riparia]|uniref:uncharacterized protein LOC117912424 isoform X2 n=1 Tax=Vitis riparia TaxID=96939 RepID=UPI00155B00A2|nr:uncharacterized protein LOC117912424 isoform X2 [Vitis riparia]XP_034690249.1 uncharacterized protein LOC117917895 isoform X2 [Vitis riparia]